jgi:hypothetical protein
MFFRKCMLPLTAILIAFSASAQTTSTTSATRSFDFPPVGLASSETMQINVVNSAAASSSGTAASCTGTISFTTSGGTVIGTAASFTVSSGEISSATLPFTKTSATGTRVEIVGVISVTATSGTPCALRTSLETFDTDSGDTHVYLAGFGGPGGPGGGPGGPGGPGH